MIVAAVPRWLRVPSPLALYPGLEAHCTHARVSAAGVAQHPGTVSNAWDVETQDLIHCLQPTNQHFAIFAVSAAEELVHSADYSHQNQRWQCCAG